MFKVTCQMNLRNFPMNNTPFFLIWIFFIKFIIEINQNIQIRKNDCDCSYSKVLITKLMSIVVSLNNKNLFGINGQLAYHSTTDLSRFSELTKTIGNVVMGANTWKSIPTSKKPLVDRMNVVVTKDYDLQKEISQLNNPRVKFVENLEKVFDILEEPCFIGGSVLITSIFQSRFIDKIQKLFVTYYNDDLSPENGTFLNIPLDRFKIKNHFHTNNVKTTLFSGDIKEIQLTQVTYKKNFTKHNYEAEYLNALYEIMKQPPRQGRNGITHSIFGLQFKYDCSDGKVPLLTTKKMAWKTCIKELLWFIRGDTDNKILRNQNVHIWDQNSTREFLDSRGLTHLQENDLGAVYGFQWRHFGAKYVNCESDYFKQGVDQLEMCVNMLKTDKYSRRIIMTAWNPCDLENCCLPPCHCFIQWYVDANDKLCLQFYQRSADMFLGVPFNQFSYGVFLNIMCLKTGLSPGYVVHSIGDAHVYADHTDAIRKQLENPILEQPKIKINFKNNWIDYNITDFELIDYKSASKISASMSA